MESCIGCRAFLKQSLNFFYFFLLPQSVLPSCLCSCFLTDYLIQQKFRMSTSRILLFNILLYCSYQQEYIHILTFQQLLSSICTAVVIHYTFILLTHKLQLSLAFLFALVLRTDHDKYNIYNYVNIKYSGNKWGYILREEENII